MHSEPAPFWLGEMKLKAQSLFLLRQIIGLPGTATTIQEIYTGGKLLATLPKGEPGATVEAMNAPVEVELSLDERAFVKKAFEFALSKQALPASEYANDIIEVLELVPKS